MTTGLGDHRGLSCPGCGVRVRAKDPALWLERSGPDARAWHFDCRLQEIQRCPYCAPDEKCALHVGTVA